MMQTFSSGCWHNIKRHPDASASRWLANQGSLAYFVFQLKVTEWVTFLRLSCQPQWQMYRRSSWRGMPTASWSISQSIVNCQNSDSLHESTLRGHDVLQCHLSNGLSAQLRLHGPNDRAFISAIAISVTSIETFLVRWSPSVKVGQRVHFI